MGPVRLATAAVMLCGMLTIRQATAQDGKVRFTGAVLVPTCALDPGAMAARGAMPAAALRNASSPVPCADGARRGAPASSYQLKVTRLDDARAQGSALLEYFAHSPNKGTPREIVIRTYE